MSSIVYIRISQTAQEMQTKRTRRKRPSNGWPGRQCRHPSLQRVQLVDVVAKPSSELSKKWLEFRNLSLTSLREPILRSRNDLGKLFHRVENGGQILALVYSESALFTDRIHFFVHRVQCAVQAGCRVRSVYQIESLVQLVQSRIGIYLIAVIPRGISRVVPIRRGEPPSSTNDVGLAALLRISAPFITWRHKSSTQRGSRRDAR